MSIVKIYHVSVDIPEEVWYRFGHTPEYSKRSLTATKGSVDAGSECYSTPYEWAEFPVLDDAKRCEKELMDMCYYFSAKLLKDES